MSKVQKDKDSLWTADIQYYRSTKTMVLGAYQPNKNICQSYKTTSERWQNHQEVCEPHLYDNY